MKKISIIVPCYGTEEYVEKCINSLINQSYKNIEIIAVNDCSKGNMQEILESLKEKDNRIKVYKNEKNLGLLHTRIVGSKKATGDYISFVDSDDYVDLDFYRLLLEKAEEDESDIVISNFVRESKVKKYINSLQFNSNNKTYERDEFLDKYFKQTGRQVRYHIWSKIIKIDVWKEAIKEIEKVKERLLMCEDFLFATILSYYSKRVSFCDDAIYYYTINDNQSTSDEKLNIDKINRNIEDIQKVFDFVIKFLKNKKEYELYKEYIEEWKYAYINIHINNYKKYSKNNKNIEQLSYDYENDKDYQNFIEKTKNDKSRDNFLELFTPYNDDFSEMKKIIMSDDIEIVSFDMFDTLVVRPFLVPSDMFTLLNKEFHKHFKIMNVMDFGIIRKKSEQELRNIKFKQEIWEITLDEIYDHIAKNYNLDRKLLSKIEEKEKEMEIHFCYRRNSGYQLYKLAKQLNKKVILTSDIYLSRDVLLKILKKNGYEFDEYYISSELLLTKDNGNLFDYIKDKEKTDKIYHIGDNYRSDIEKSTEHGLKGGFLPKASSVLLGLSNNQVGHCGNLYKYFDCFNIDHVPYEENYGVRCSLGIVANYYFDNPFRTFNKYTDFNGDPYFIGYYALGMQTLSICKWLFEDAKENNIESIAFMARDGYQPYKAAQIFNEKTKYIDKINLNYTYVSRKSLLPLLLKDKVGTSLIDTYHDYSILAPKDLFKIFNKVISYDEKKEKEINKEYPINELFKSKDEFNKCISLIYDKCFDKEKYNAYFKICKEYFDEQFSGKASTFDVGYSGKPEAIITSILDKPITTYFIHTNNSSAFKNSRIGNFKLKTYYDFKPTLTGTIRELFISYVGPSCTGYKYKDNKVVPEFGTLKNYNYFNIDMIEKVQQGSLDFVSTFCDFFSEYIDEIDLNKYYMSLPLEYYYHYVHVEDRIPIKNLMFEDNVNHLVELNDFIFNVYNNYSNEYSLGFIPKKLSPMVDYSLPRSRVKRIVHYALHDRESLKKKIDSWKDKKNHPEQLPKSRVKRAAYYLIFDRSKIKNRLLKK